jgi:hypothetical protein
MTEQRTTKVKKTLTQLIFGNYSFFSPVFLFSCSFFVFNLLSASLQKQLDDLDKTLYKDLIRQGKLNQMQQKRDRSILGGNHLRGLHKQKSSRRKLKKENSGNLSSAVSRGDISGSDKDSDTRSIKTDKSDSKLSNKRRITFEDLNKHSMSHRSSRTSHQSEDTTITPIKAKVVSSGNTPDSIGVDKDNNKTGGNILTEFKIVEKDCQENLDKMGSTAFASSVKNCNPEPEEDEEEDEDEMDEDQVGEILENKYVPVHLRHPFLSCLPNNPRDSILPTGSLSTEAVQDLANDKLRKMALVEEIFDEIMLQRQAMDPRHFRIDNLKKKKKTDTELPEEENEEEDDADVILNYNAEFQDLNIDSAKLVPQKTRIYYVSSINAVSRYVDLLLVLSFFLS